MLLLSNVFVLVATVGFLVQSHCLHVRGPGPGKGTRLLDNGTEDVANLTLDVEEAFMHQHKPKLVFTAGLEGSGVRVFQEIWKRSFEYEDEPNQHVLKFNTNWTCGHNWPFSDYNTMRDKIMTVKVNDICALPFQATYPSCGVNTDEHEARMLWFHPEIQWLVHASHDAGADLHVILMRRDVEDALKYSCKNEIYEVTCALQAESLIANANELLYQIEELRQHDSTKLSCFNFTNDKEVHEDALRVFHPALPNIDHEFVRRNISHVPDFTDEELEGQLDLLHNKTRQLDEMCAKLSKFRLEDWKRFIEIGHGSPDRLHVLTPQR